jgi:hypothetical protein
LDMQRVAELADVKHPLLVEQLFDPVMLVEISKWEEIEEKLKLREGEDDFEPAREGAVYFCDTPSMKGSIMKIGGSKYDGKTRARTLYDAGVPEPFTCRLEKRFSDWKLYERAIQAYLSNVRVYTKKEFFVITIHEAQSILDQIEGTASRTKDEEIRWNAAFAKTKSKIEKYRRLWQLKKDELTKANNKTEERCNPLTQELEMLRKQCEILRSERDHALEKCITGKNELVETQCTNAKSISTNSLFTQPPPEGQPSRSAHAASASILSPTILPIICNFLTDVQILGNLCKTNKSCRDYLLSLDAGKHWVISGKLVCGEEHWNDAIFHQVLNEDDGRYKTMLHMCPWRSLPKKFKVNTLKGLSLINTGYNRGYEIMGMKLDRDGPDTLSAMNMNILLHVENHTDVILGGPKAICTTSRVEFDEYAEGEEYHWKPRDNNLKRIPSEEEMEIFNDLDRDEEFTKALSIYGSGHIDDVQILNKGVFAAVYYSGERYRNLLFISMHDRRKILWDANIQGGDAYGVLFSPGEMWFVTDSCQLWYFGPNKDKQLTTGFGGGSQFGLDGRIPRAFCAMISGQSSIALSMLKTMNLDLFAVHAPNTKLTLFDVAADPYEGLECSWKTKQHLNPDAAMLLEKEPLFKISIFMMMMAFFHVDDNAFRDLISKGLKFMPCKKLRRACYEKLDFEKVCSILINHGVTILEEDGRKYLGHGQWKNIE